VLLPRRSIRRLRPVRTLVHAGLAAALALTVASGAVGQQGAESGVVRTTISGQALGGFVLPVTPLEHELSIRGHRAWAWSVDDTQRLVVEGEVAIEFGSYRFRADEAVVWINRLPSAQGEITQFAIYFDEVREPTQRAGLTAGGRDLLVTGSAIGPVTLGTANLDRAAAPRSPVLVAAERRLAEYLKRLLASPPPLAARPTLDRPDQTEAELVVGGPIPPPEAAFPDLPRDVLLPRPDLENVPIFKPGGVIAFTAGVTTIEPSDDAIVAERGVTVEYAPADRSDEKRLEMTAERAVIFTAEGAMESMREGAATIDVSSVKGIYLEGGVVATDGEITLRAEKIYYDLPNNQALAIDAVLRTYVRLRETLPVYARAEEMRQVAANQWKASEAIVSTSEFFTPHLSLGMKEFTVTERPDGVFVEGEHATVRAGGVPLFYWPGFSGRPERIPLRSARVGYENDRGVEIETRWDLMSLLGLEAPDELEADLNIDGYTARGAGLGTTMRWRDNTTIANLDLYGLYQSAGQDRTDAGITQDTDAGFRGLATADFMTELSADMTLRGQVAWISDESYITTWRRVDYEVRREYETSLGFNWISENTSLDAYLKYDVNDFLSNSWLIASRGYAVDRFPSVNYTRVGDSLFSDLLTWSSEYRYDYMRLVITSGTAQSLGVRPQTFATNNRNIAVQDLYDAAGYSQDEVMRFNTRQELALPVAWGPLKVVPFASLQLSGYLGGEFLRNYSPDFNTIRFIGGVGARMSATFTRVGDDLRSRFFDINRVRHVVEPYATLWYGYDSLSDSPLPVYDQTIEGASGATVAAVGLRQRFQTQRGGPGNWRSVDFLTIDLGAAFNPSDDNFQPDLTNSVTAQRYAQSPIPRFFEWRPELSQWGSHVYGSASWEVSDTFTIAGRAIYMLEDRDLITTSGFLENLALGTVGFSMRHSPQVSSFLEYRYLAPDQTELLQGGLTYQLSRKYAVIFSPQYDVRRGEFRAISGSLERSFPDFNLVFSGGYDLVLDEVAVSVNFSIPGVTRTTPRGIADFGQ
jgi:lipopolysaccharide export system protein LptA